MNSFNNNFEKQLKKQIDEREIAPSRDLWAEIQIQTENASPTKSKLNWLLLTACFVLILGLGAVLLLKNDSETTVQMAETEKTSDISEQNLGKQLQMANNKGNIEKVEGGKFTHIENSPSELKIEKVVSLKNEIPLIKENPSEIASQIITQNQPAKIMAKSDSVKVQKKKRYVDPSTLLFSVEHKDVIEKSKEGSNVATIDLNNK